MASVSFTQAELLVRAQQAGPYIFNQGEHITLTDVSLSNPVEILQELGKILRVCLSTRDPEAIHVEKVNPLTFTVRRTIGCANRGNWMSAPMNRFAFRAIATLHEGDVIAKKATAVWELKRTPRESIEKVLYKSHDGTERTFLDMLEKTHTDGIVILRDGEIIYENYFQGQDAETPHIQFSVTKSLIGMIVAQLVVEGVIDPEKQVVEYIPELAGSAFGDARVVEILDMTAGTHYNEDYDNPDSEVRRHLIAAGYLNQPADFNYPKTLRAFLPTIKKEGEHHQVFHYVSAHTEVLSWLVEKACKSTVNKIFEEKIWSKIGAEHDAFILKDSAGDASWAGGFTATTRDMARVGQMILNRGRAEKEQLLSQETFEWMSSRDLRPQYAQSIFNQLFPATKGWSYVNQF